MTMLKDLVSRIPPPLVPALGAALSFLAGLAVALMLDYLLYRLGMPGKPFIYVSF